MEEIYDFLGEIDKLDEEGQAELEKLIDRTNEIKQLPLVARKIMQVIENPKSTAGDLEEVIKSDQALTIKILKIANSSFYGLLRKVNTLQRAILVVGFKAIKDIAVSTAILNMYRSSDPYSIKLWEQAIASGIAARLVSLEFENSETEEAFVGGLLHSIGKVLFVRAYPNELKNIRQAMEKDPTLDELDLEKQAFGFAHTHAGGQLAKNWNLSSTLEAVIRYHHHLPEVLWTEISSSIKLNIAVVSLARKICIYLGIGRDKPEPNTQLLNSKENEFLQIPEERLKELTEEIRLAFFEESQLFA